MRAMIEQALDNYERGQVTRRQFVASLAMLMTGSLARGQDSGSSIAAKTLNHVTLRVSNVDRSVRFYQQLFEMPIANRQQNSVGLELGSSHIGISQAQNGEQPHINHFCLGVQDFDVDRIIELLAARGVKGSVRMRGDVKELYFKDPDNIRVQLQDVNYRG
jgi:catechol 2,3-dioxygenase-like lactoylglutathione lyase family enzyme